MTKQTIQNWKVSLQTLSIVFVLLLNMAFACGDSNDTTSDTDSTASTTNSGLKVGEYACYGSGGRIMIGLGFKVLSANRYTDLEDGNAGSFVIAADTVKFRGGHLDGQTGRDLKNYSFTIGKQAQCEPF